MNRENGIQQNHVRMSKGGNVEKRDRVERVRKNEDGEYETSGGEGEEVEIRGREDRKGEGDAEERMRNVVIVRLTGKGQVKKGERVDGKRIRDGVKQDQRVGETEVDRAGIRMKVIGV